MISEELQLLSGKISVLRKLFRNANKKYDELIETCKINKYFSLEDNQPNFTKPKHAIYEFCAGKLKQTENYEEKISNILAITNNEFIDVIFIGRCSVGKSKIINAILMENILPWATSTTTHCFVDISKSRDDINYSSLNRDEKNPFEFDNLIIEINNKISSLNDTCQFNKTVHIFLSQSRWNTKLTNGKQSKNIRLIDTPGYDNCELSSDSNDNSSIENSIINRCKIANIIVLVVTHNLSDQEKEILMELDKISSKLSIFVLVNKWDLSDNDPAEKRDASKSRIRDSFKNLNKIYFVSADEQINHISAQNNNDNELSEPSQKQQDEFHNFILHLNEEINDPTFLIFDKHISDFDTFYNETVKNYEEYVKKLSDNNKYLLNSINEIKKELESSKNKTKEKISKLKLKENIILDSIEKFNLVDKFDKQFELVENDLQRRLQIIYDDFINGNYSHYNSYWQHGKYYIATALKIVYVSFQYFEKWHTYKIPRIHNRDVYQAEELTESTSQNDYFFNKLLDCIDKKFSITSDQIDNLSKFIREYCEFFKTNLISC